MPNLEEHPNSSSVETSEETTQQNVQPEEQSRELTQTDRINQRLLKSFLERMNNGNVLANSNFEKSNLDSSSFDDSD